MLGESAQRCAAERLGLESYIGRSPNRNVGLMISPIMYSATSSPYVLLCQTLDLMSPLDTAAFVLFISFVSHFVTLSDAES